MRFFAVIPCFNVGKNIITLVKKTLKYVDKIVIVDDCCPLNTGNIVKKTFKNNKKIFVIKNLNNLGVGGAVKKGYKFSLKKKSKYIIKLDGDGQMDPKYINSFKKKIILLDADYIKGNRFFVSKDLFKMPTLRLIGNIGVSILGKFSTGYWHIFDFTNGYTMISAKILKKVNLNNIKNNYFFETDILFQLNKVNAQVHDLCILATYITIKINLKINQVIN